MYQFSYGEIQADSPVDARAHERAVLDHAVRLLRTAERSPGDGAEAIDFTARLWGALVSDLAHPGNDLPDDLKARLMSVGLWILAETCRIKDGESGNFRGIADICSIVRDGLN